MESFCLYSHLSFMNQRPIARILATPLPSKLAACVLLNQWPLKHNDFLRQTNVSGGEFNFDKDLRNGILGSFFYGYLATQILGGWICDRFGPKIGIVAGIGVLSIGAILSPPAVR